MKIYRVTWEEICSVEVTAETEEEAKDRVLSGIVEENQISREFVGGSDEVEEVT
jgi:hypothetical protein